MFLSLSCFYFIVISPALAQNNSPAVSPGEAQMRHGYFLLQEADALTKASETQLQKSNALRQQILQLRRENPGAPPSNNAQALIQEVETLQQQGQLLRLQANTRRDNAIAELSQGMQTLWADWISLPQPMTSQLSFSQAELATQAHNTTERSVHPGMQDSDEQPQVIRQKDMSLATNISTAQNLPADIDRSVFQLSRNQTIMGHIEVATEAKLSEAMPLTNTAPLNQIHVWRLVLCDLYGKPISGADVKFAGHMPGHVHGLPTQPVISQELSPGVYQVDGVKFQMQGWWVIDFIINHRDTEDTLRFNVVL